MRLGGQSTREGREGKAHLLPCCTAILAMAEEDLSEFTGLHLTSQGKGWFLAHLVALVTGTEKKLRKENTGISKSIRQKRNVEP